MSDYKRSLVRVIRRLQTVVSIVLFFIIFLFCWNVTGFQIEEIQLSHWGGPDVPTTHLWNGVVVLLSLSILFNAIIFIKKHIRMHNKILPYILFSTVSLCLFMVGIFSVKYSIIHNVAAFTYFFLYPLSIFTMAYINRKTLLYKEWFIHLMFSISMVVLPLTAITIFSGMAISETLHIIVVCGWNLYAAFKKFLE
jgi:hypothetical membrane protein